MQRFPPSGAQALPIVSGGLAVLWMAARLQRLEVTRNNRPAPPSRVVPATPVRRLFEARLDSRSTTLRSPGMALHGQQTETARATFRTARRLYKETEFLIFSASP